MNIQNWIPGWSIVGSDIVIEDYNTNMPELTAVEADEATGYIGDIMHAILDKMFASLENAPAGSFALGSNFWITKSVDSTDLTNIKTIYTVNIRQAVLAADNVIRGVNSVATPANLTATDSTHADKVVVSWDAAAGADGYYIYRTATNVPPTTDPIGTVLQGTLSYDDTTAVAGVTYYYWVKAYNQFGAGAFSNSDAGTRSA